MRRNIFAGLFCFLLINATPSPVAGSIFDDAISGGSTTATGTAATPPAPIYHSTPTSRPTVKPMPGPSTADGDRGMKLIRKVAGDRPADLRSVGQSYIAKVKTLISDVKDDPESTYAVYTELRDVAIPSQDCDTLILASNYLTRHYDLDPISERCRIAKALGSGVWNADEQTKLISFLLPGVEQSVAAGRTEDHEALCSFISEFAAKLADPVLRDFQLQQLARAKQAGQEGRKADDARQQIERGDLTGDPHGVVARYECFIRADWASGLAHFEACSDAKLKSLATSEKTAQGVRLATVADRWLEIASQLEHKYQKEAIFSHAFNLYVKAKSQAQGAQVEAITKRLDNLEILRYPSDVPPRTICFVLDGTGTMVGARYAALTPQLVDTIFKLPPNNSFNIFIFHRGGEVAALAPTLMKCTSENRKKAIDFIDKFDPFGKTNPLPALKRAIALKPDVMIFLSDGEFDDMVKYDEVIKTINAANPKKTMAVNTYLTGQRDSRAEETMRAIASQNKGQFRYVTLGQRAER